MRLPTPHDGNAELEFIIVIRERASDKMAGKNVSSVDEKGRVLIPQSIRDALNLKAGEKVVLEMDSAGKSVKIEPAYEKKLLKLHILLSDQPGALATAASALARIQVDLVSTQSHSSNRGEAAEWVVQCNPGKAGIEGIKSALGKAGAKVKESYWE